MKKETDSFTHSTIKLELAQECNVSVSDGKCAKVISVLLESQEVKV